MRRIELAAVALALVGAVALAGCTSSGSGGSTKSGLATGMSDKGGGAGASASNDRPAVAPDRGADAGSVPIAKTLPAQALIRTADISVELAHGRSVAAPADRAEQIAVAAGGQVFADERTGGRSPTATITLKVPGDALGAVVDKLAALGKEKARRTSTQDVTTQVADVDSRVRSARASIAQLRLLFDRAVKVSDLIALESELSQREADLEALEAQQRSLAAQTTMATVSLHLSTAGTARITHKDAETGGFVGGLRDGWHAFASAAGAVATGVGAVLPFLVLALVIASAAVVLRRRYRSSSPPVLPPADPA
jgi:hypothetical protein